MLFHDRTVLAAGASCVDLQAVLDRPLHQLNQPPNSDRQHLFCNRIASREPRRPGEHHLGLPTDLHRSLRERIASPALVGLS